MLQVVDSLALGGAERSLHAMAPHLRSRGVELAVAAFADGPLAAAFAQDNIPVAFAQGGSRVHRLRRLVDVVREHAPDLIHTTLFEADVLGRLAGRRTHVAVVSSLVNVSYGREHAQQPGIGRVRLRGAQAADALTARHVVRFHAVSHVVASTMARRLCIPQRRIDVVWRGRDAQALGRRTDGRRSAARAGLGVHSDSPIILVLARHEFDKGIDVAIEAVARLLEARGDAKLFVAGRTGNGTPALRALISERCLSEQVRLLGPREDVADLLCAADVFAAPSRREGLPGSVLEAMALEVPIVVSDIPPMREVLGDTHALFTPVDDADSLAAAIDRCLTAGDEADQRTSAARRRFCDHFSIDRAADGMAAFYERALGESAR